MKRVRSSRRRAARDGSSRLGPVAETLDHRVDVEAISHADTVASSMPVLVVSFETRREVRTSSTVVICVGSSRPTGSASLFGASSVLVAWSGLRRRGCARPWSRPPPRFRRPSGSRRAVRASANGRILRHLLLHVGQGVQSGHVPLRLGMPPVEERQDADHHSDGCEAAHNQGQLGVGGQTTAAGRARPGGSVSSVTISGACSTAVVVVCGVVVEVVDVDEAGRRGVVVVWSMWSASWSSRRGRVVEVVEVAPRWSR